MPFTQLLNAYYTAKKTTERSAPMSTDYHTFSEKLVYEISAAVPYEAPQFG